MLTTITLDRLERQVFEALDQARTGAAEAGLDAETRAIRQEQLAKAEALRDAFRALSAAKSEEINLGFRRAIQGL